MGGGGKVIPCRVPQSLLFIMFVISCDLMSTHCSFEMVPNNVEHVFTTNVMFRKGGTHCMGGIGQIVYCVEQWTERNLSHKHAFAILKLGAIQLN